MNDDRCTLLHRINVISWSRDRSRLCCNTAPHHILPLRCSWWLLLSTTSFGGPWHYLRQNQVSNTATLQTVNAGAPEDRLFSLYFYLHDIHTSSSKYNSIYSNEQVLCTLSHTHIMTHLVCSPPCSQSCSKAREDSPLDRYFHTVGPTQATSGRSSPDLLYSETRLHNVSDSAFIYPIRALYQMPTCCMSLSTLGWWQLCLGCVWTSYHYDSTVSGVWDDINVNYTFVGTR